MDNKPKLTQKHFEHSSAIILDLRTTYPNSDAVLDALVERIIPIYQSVNPRFNPTLFRLGCGVMNQ